MLVMHLQLKNELLTSAQSAFGQSYEHSMIIIYVSRVVNITILLVSTTLEL